MVSYYTTSKKKEHLQNTCLFSKPPEIDMQEELKPKTGFTNLTNIWRLCSLVLMLYVLNITAGLVLSEFHTWLC